MAADMREFASNGWLNIAGGCCGTTPAHIRAIADAVRGRAPHILSTVQRYTRFSGLEPLVLRPDEAVRFTFLPRGLRPTDVAATWKAGGQDILSDLRKRHIGYVLQTGGLLPYLTVGENIGTVPRLLGWDKARTAARVDELMTLFQLDPAQFRDRRTIRSEVSGFGPVHGR